MRLRIADLFIDVDCDDTVADRLSNFKPFVCTEDDPSLPVICKMETGRPVVQEESEPVLTNVLDGRTIRLWLSQDYCKLSLSVRDQGTVYGLQADRRWQTVATDWRPDVSDSYAALTDLVMLAFVYSSAFHHAVTIHASCVAVGNKGCAFIGPSGVGKSTHARLWLRHIPRARLLNDDQPVIRCTSDGTASIYGSPWSGQTPCYRNEKASLESLFFMEQALENELTALSGIETFQRMARATSLIGRDAVSFGPISSTLAALAGHVPAFLLRNRPEKEAACLSHRAFVQACGSRQDMP